MEPISRRPSRQETTLSGSQRLQARRTDLCHAPGAQRRLPLPSALDKGYAHPNRPSTLHGPRRRLDAPGHGHSGETAWPGGAISSTPVWPPGAGGLGTKHPISFSMGGLLAAGECSASAAAVARARVAQRRGLPASSRPVANARSPLGPTSPRGCASAARIYPLCHCHCPRPG